MRHKKYFPFIFQLYCFKIPIGQVIYIYIYKFYLIYYHVRLTCSHRYPSTTPFIFFYNNLFIYFLITLVLEKTRNSKAIQIINRALPISFIVYSSLAGIDPSRRSLLKLGFCSNPKELPVSLRIHGSRGGGGDLRDPKP